MFGLWAILKSPLVIGTDLRKLSRAALKILTAEEVIAVNQDELGVAGDLVAKEGPEEVRPLHFRGLCHEVNKCRGGSVAFFCAAAGKAAWEILIGVLLSSRCTQGHSRMALEQWLFSTGTPLAHSIPSQISPSTGRALVGDNLLLDSYQNALRSYPPLYGCTPV